MYMRFRPLVIIAACLLGCVSCSHQSSLRDELYALTDTVPGTVGIAFVSDHDTITVNNGVRFPMMSVFKLHEALAVVHALETQGTTLDSVLLIRSSELDRDTWSPMLEKYTADEFRISVGELMSYAVCRSDNNAGNLLFSHIVSPAETNRFIKSIAADTTFEIRHAESEMKADHVLSYRNHTSPLSAALLIRHVFEDSLVDKAGQDSIRHCLAVVTTGHDRLGAAVDEAEVETFAHKTGSGYRNGAGELMAHNDVGYFRLRDGRSYALSVFIRDFRGSEDEASKVIADISKCVYRHFSLSQ